MLSQEKIGGKYYINLNIPKSKEKIHIPKSISRQGGEKIIKYIREKLLGKREKRQRVKRVATRDKVKRLRADVRGQSAVNQTLGIPTQQIQQPQKIEYYLHAPGLEKLGMKYLEDNKEKVTNIASTTPVIDADHRYAHPPVELVENPLDAAQDILMRRRL